MKILRIFLLLTVFISSAANAVDQTLVKSLRKNGFISKKPFIPIFDKLRQSTVKFISGEDDLAHGVVLTASGLVITKKSEVIDAENLQVQTPAGEIVSVFLVGFEDRRDLALYRVKARGLTPASWADQKDVQVGQWSISPLLSDFEGKIGVMAVRPRELPEQPLLGAKNALLSGEISSRPDGYPLVYQHELPFLKYEIGGPLGNSTGKVIGLNISRANGCEFYTLPAVEIKKSLQSMKVPEQTAQELSQLEFPEQYLFATDTHHLLDKSHLELQQKMVKLQPEVSDKVVAVKIGSDNWGSGVLISADGYILTAAHVSGEPGTTLGVILHNKKEYRAKALGFYRKTDISLLKIIDPLTEDLPYAQMGNVHDIKATDWCFVLAHPNGYRDQRGSVLRSGKILRTSLNNFIRTDCNLIGGDSGGPLFNMNGEVIAINSKVRTGTYEGNFHGTVSGYQANWQEFLKEQEVPELSIKPFLTIAKFTAGFRARTTVEGAIVLAVVPDSPAFKAGLKEGDTILRINSRQIGGLYSLRQFFLQQQTPQMVMKVMRRNAEKTIALEAVLNSARNL